MGVCTPTHLEVKSGSRRLDKADWRRLALHTGLWTVHDARRGFISLDVGSPSVECGMGDLKVTVPNLGVFILHYP